MNEFDGIENLTIEVSGGGTITAMNEISNLSNLDIQVSGICKFNGYPIISKNCWLGVTGTGSYHVYCEDELNIDISGAAKVYYRGFPSINQRVSGLGRVVDDN